MSKKDAILIEGFGFSNYRSIGETPVLLYPLRKINVLIGANNSGKTNILRFMYDFFSKDRLKLNANDYHNYDKNNKCEVFFPVKIDEFSGIKCRYSRENTQINEAVLNILCSNEMFYNSEQRICWKGRELELDFFSRYSRDINSGILKNFALDYSSSADDNDASNLKSIVLQYLETVPSVRLLDLVYIPADRDLYDNNKNTFLPGNQTIIKNLLSILHPDDTDNNARKKKKCINRFISELLGYRVELSVPASGATINIEKKDTSDSLDSEEIVRSLENVGSGIHEVIYIAIVATLNPKHFICIDEPEIHMHPRLLRKLIQYLEINTDCQFMFSTHSNCFLDIVSQDMSVFKVFLEKDDTTRVEFAASSESMVSINNQLGNRASELLQSNCAIWVEGPSDRIYINFWIHEKKPSFVEGIDYSIMFYGGRLLSHLTSESNPDKELIELLRINRNSYIVMDRDRENLEAEVNDTKKRIIDSFPNAFWLTKGREIENYLPYQKYVEIASRIKPSFSPVSEQDGVFTNRLRSADGCLDKVEFAREYVSTAENCDFEVLDLDEQIERLISFIDKANR